MKYVVMEMAIIPMEDERAAKFQTLGYPVCDSEEAAKKEVSGYVDRLCQPFRAIEAAFGFSAKPLPSPQAPALTDATELEQSSEDVRKTGGLS